MNGEMEEPGQLGLALKNPESILELVLKVALPPLKVKKILKEENRVANNKEYT